MTPNSKIKKSPNEKKRKRRQGPREGKERKPTLMDGDNEEAKWIKDTELEVQLDNYGYPSQE